MVCEQYFRIKRNGEAYSNCYCRHPELIENYDKAVADATQVYEVHHRLETHTSDGERRLVELTREELIALGMYYDRPAEEFIFLTIDEHNKLHHIGMKFSEEAKRKISEAMINHKSHSKKVICVETNEVFESVRDAFRKTGIYYVGISQVCRRERKTAGGYHWQHL